MVSERDIRQSFLAQAKSCDSLGSPFTARLCRLAAARLDRADAVGRHVLDWSRDPSSTGDALALRLAGSLHALVLSGASTPLAEVYPPNEVSDDRLWSSVADSFRSDEDFILERLRAAPQTNEVRRSSALLPGFFTLARLFGLPLVLSEIGASAGLNLQWDSYAYDLGGFRWGASSPVTLSPEWTGPPPPDANIRIAGRAGCDLNPLDAASADDRLRLLSYIWADQTDRLERTRTALAIASENRVTVNKADAVDWLKTRLAQAFPGTVHVVYHSIAWQYLPDTLQREGDALILKAGEKTTQDAPLARLQMEADGKPEGAALTLQIWPSGEKHEIGRADFHGRWVKWSGWPAL